VALVPERSYRWAPAALLCAETDGVTSAEVMDRFNAGLHALEASAEGVPETLDDPPAMPTHRMGNTYF
jgi:hypothetical protein